MKTTTTLIAALGIAALASISFVGCDSEPETGNNGFVGQVVDSVALAVADNLQEAARAPEDTDVIEEVLLPATDLAVTIYDPEFEPAVRDLLADGDTVYAIYDGALLVYDLTTDDYSLAVGDDALTTLVRHAGSIFAAGERLYRVDGAELIPDETEFNGRVKSLCSFDASLMIGTDCGLYARNLLGTTLLLEDMDVSAMVADREGLWIGTHGNGLFRWDGEEYRQRYLTRDESLFDHVTALAYNHDHVYLGTVNGMFVFDGGSWKTLTIEDGLPGNVVTSLDATGWVVYVGTNAGMASFFDGEFSPVKSLETQMITAIDRVEHNLFAGTVEDGIVLKSGPTVKTLMEPQLQPEQGLAAVIH